jgi:hypothetical protein
MFINVVAVLEFDHESVLMTVRETCQVAGIIESNTVAVVGT